MKAKGLYIHIPFCLSKCAYCDFCSFTRFDERLINSYVDALVREISEYKRKERIPVDTVFIGGGTPSILSPSQLGKITSAINDTFDLTSLSEFTVEVNPRTADKEKLSAYRTLGVNRISIGLQSIHENELKILGRNQSFEDFVAVYSSARDAGFTNISVDIMYGIPSQTKESLLETLSRVISLSPEHISLYSLILEEGTPIYENADSLAIPDDDTVFEMYSLVNSTLRENGYLHYEISNYARPGFSSLHNMKYWQLDDYIGVGISAHSFFEGERFYNPADRFDISTLTDYINARRSRTFEDKAKREDILCEFVMLGLRTSSGISLSEYKKRFGECFITPRTAVIDELIKNGLAEISTDRFYLTEQGMFVSNSIICELLKST